MCMQKFTDGQIVSKVLCCSEISSLTFSVFWRDAERMLHWHWYSNYQRASYATQHIPFYVLSYYMNTKINQPEPQGEHLPCYVIVMHCLCHWGTLSVKASILRCLVQPFSCCPLQSLCQWVLSVKKNYRKHVAYHNWRHAFNTAQSMFALLKSGRLQVSPAYHCFLWDWSAAELYVKDSNIRRYISSGLCDSFS